MVALLLHDFEFIGNTGNTVGYVLNASNSEVVKIVYGEAKPFADDMIEAEGLDTPPGEREAKIDTTTDRIHFEELNNEEQQEIIQTIEEILNISDSYFEEAVKQCVEVDERFQIILDKLFWKERIIC